MIMSAWPLKERIKMNRIYMDNAATTRVREPVAQALSLIHI